MKELLILLIIGFSLSIDAFSVSTVIGLSNPPIKKSLFISLLVGIFHFIMPILGVLLSRKILYFVNINMDFLLGIILLIIALQMFIEYIKPSKKEFMINKLSVFLFSFGVSLDSFTLGIGLKAITNNILLACFVFSITSLSFTFLGLTIGKYINKILKKYSYLAGTLVLFILGILFFLKIF